MGHDDLTYVTDAVANAVFRVDPNTGEVEVAAAFDGLPGVFPNLWHGGEWITDPVPTAAVMDENNRAYGLMSPCFLMRHLFRVRQR